ncbi:MAG TPA: hypothetical protein PK079_14420 [Leptospiraceae bacterium]|nr:hypothetical protein [Leptospiraceae bacterium]HMW07740.1 hypothetical protein [Leptospiraceae bacterium]HMX31990.1 hypothetical protein [Leptospiraceae bacterium]HMY33406.1 hypothetical protein [Leptospiraceae bacterium]HMZ64786.1 hypothetical protein [Leptospiraceae bacterium]
MFRFLCIIGFAVFLLVGCKEKNGNIGNSNPNLTTEEKKSEFIKAQISWAYIDLPLEMKIYEIKSQQSYELWETRSVPSKDSSPASIEIPNSTIVIQSGRYKEFILGMQNQTDKPIHFFAAPHSVDPPQYSLGFKFKCLCINHAFTVKPKEFWYRVVRLNIDKEFRGDSFTIKHDLIGISEQRMKDFEFKP